MFFLKALCAVKTFFSLSNETENDTAVNPKCALLSVTKFYRTLARQRMFLSFHLFSLKIVTQSCELELELGILH